MGLEKYDGVISKLATLNIEKVNLSTTEKREIFKAITNFKKNLEKDIYLEASKAAKEYVAIDVSGKNFYQASKREDNLNKLRKNIPLAVGKNISKLFEDFDFKTLEQEAVLQTIFPKVSSLSDDIITSIKQNKFKDFNIQEQEEVNSIYKAVADFFKNIREFILDNADKMIYAATDKALENEENMPMAKFLVDLAFGEKFVAHVQREISKLELVAESLDQVKVPGMQK